jgi:hypothetical protein
MTIAEAQQLLGVEDPDDDLQDLYEEKLFEYKQFFLSKSPIAKLFASKLTRMQHLHAAFLLLGGEMLPETLAFADAPAFTDDIRSSYDLYQSQKNTLRRQLSNARSALVIAACAEGLTVLEKQFASCWFSDAAVSEAVIVSKDPDPMEILQAIRTYAAQGGTGFAQLQKLENNPPEILVHEMKRLSLLFKKY